jgi:glyoxylase-like metal-dependent hydrolase (beta-lactamase superfamily II)
METPEYSVTDWAADAQPVTYNGQNLGLQIIHTPGHTPDELALWDVHERVLFVGDTMYEWAHIVFPKEGNLITYSVTLGKLKQLVVGWNEDSSLPKVKIACGHITDSADGEELLHEVDTTFYHCVNGWLEPTGNDVFRDEPVISFARADGRISFSAPKRLFEDFRQNIAAMSAVTQRHQ